jgi:hypothetical protein
MIPHERSLVTKMQGRPFALLGVSADDSREELQQTMQKRDVTWRNWWDGAGTIQTEYGVEAYPTLVLIDARGVVRHLNQGAPKAEDLERAIDQLVAEAEREAAAPAPAAGRSDTAP